MAKAKTTQQETEQSQTTDGQHKFLLWFQTATNFEKKWRKGNERNFDFYDGEQWSDYEKGILEERGQQATVLNIVRPTIDMLVALEMEKRMDLQVVGREETDEVMAKLLTELLKQTFDENNLDFYLTESGKDGLIGGRGWMYAEATEKNDKPHISIGYIPWEEVFIDPHYRNVTGSDARYIIRSVWMYRDEVKKEWGEKAKLIDSHFKGDFKNSEYEAQTNGTGYNKRYYDSDTDRVEVCYCWYKDAEQKLHYVVFAEEIILEGSATDDSVNKNPLKIDEYPLIPFTVERDRKGQPLGIVKSLTTIQEQLNKLNSKFLWNVSANRFIFEDGAFENEAEAIEAHRQFNKPNGFIPVKNGGLGKIKMDDNLRELGFISTQMAFLIDMASRTSGINDAMLGQSGTNERSATQQQNRIMRGAAMQSRMLENLHFCKKKLAEIVLKLIGAHYTDETIVRVLGPTGSAEYFALNTQEENPETGEKVKTFDMSAALTYDVILQKVPPFSTVRERQMQIFAEIAKTGTLPPNFAGEVFMLLSDLPNKPELIEKMTGERKAIEAQAAAKAKAEAEAKLSGGAPTA